MSSDRAIADDVEDAHLGATDASDSRLSRDASSSIQKLNAFTELMRPKKSKLESTQVDKSTKHTLMFGRNGLGLYTVDPATFPADRVLYYSDKFTVIRDLFPKASVHLLILPRDAKKNVMRPQDAFDDPAFLRECQEEEVKVRGIVAEELRRRFGSYSAAEQARLQAMDAEELPDELPPGRDWSKDVISGIHANPSMTHLHIHVLSRDMVSDPMKKRNHYLSFTTDFLVGMDQFPLAEGDYRRRYSHFPENLHCWRCGKNFENKMVSLKKHLQEEFEQWIRE